MSEWYNPLPEDVGVVGGKTKKPKKESQGGSFEFSENMTTSFDGIPVVSPSVHAQGAVFIEDGSIVGLDRLPMFSFSEEHIEVKKEEKGKEGEPRQPTIYISSEGEKIILSENQFGIKATETVFGLMKPGKGLMAVTPGIIDIKIGKGLKFHQDTGKLELALDDFYPKAGGNIHYTTNEVGEFVINVTGESPLLPDSNKVPTSKSVVNYINQSIGDINNIDSSLKEENQNIVDILNLLHERDHYTHRQAIPSLTWVINHPLKKKPSVTITNENGIEMIGEVEYPSLEQIIVKFSAKFSGSALLN